MKPYVLQGGEQVYQQPFDCENALFYGMLLPAEMATLQKNVCDRLFNDPLGQPGRFVPFGPFVLLALCRLDKLDSETLPFSEWGSYAEQEIAFWVLTVDTVQEQVYFAFPYIWVDNSYALSMGREIYGFPKQFGQFQIPPDPASAGHFQLDSLAIKKLGPNSMGEWQKILEVNRTGPPPTLGQDWDTFVEAGKDFIHRLESLHDWNGDLKLLEHLFLDAVHGYVPFVFLKQFRDVVDGSKACYQAVVETTCKCTKWMGGGLLNGSYEVTMEDVQSMPIARDLGLCASPIEPLLSYWCRFNFFIGNGTPL